MHFTCTYTTEAIHLFNTFNMFIIHKSSSYSGRGKYTREMQLYTYLIIELARNYLCRCNVPPNHRAVCSSITQQHCHPRPGRDSTRNKGNTSKLTHSQGYTKLGQANTVGFIRITWSWKGWMLS